MDGRFDFCWADIAISCSPSLAWPPAVRVRVLTAVNSFLLFTLHDFVSASHFRTPRWVTKLRSRTSNSLDRYYVFSTVSNLNFVPHTDSGADIISAWKLSHSGFAATIWCRNTCGLAEARKTSSSGTRTNLNGKFQFLW